MLTFCVKCRKTTENLNSKIFKTKATTNNFSNYKKMHIYCKNCKKYTGNAFPKKLVLISKNKIKGKSNSAICLTKKTFIHEIEGKYDLETELEIYLQFFND